MSIRCTSMDPHRLDLFTNVSQIYGCFFPWDLVMSHFINLYLTMVFQYLESTLHKLIVATRSNLGQAFGLSGRTFVKMVCIKLVNRSNLCGSMDVQRMDIQCLPSFEVMIVTGHLNMCILMRTFR